MEKILLIDFGSTFTKGTLVDMENEEIICTSTTFTTVDTDIMEGFNKILDNMEKQLGKLEDYKYMACSSAAGGLRMVVSGLVEGVTTKAAKEACLGAGAKVIKTYAYEITKENMEEIENINPEIFLLAGGTDGGDKKCILHNAQMLSKCKLNFPIIIAGNKEVSSKCKSILEKKEVYVVENVMPKFGELNIKPAQNKIREIFLDKIIYAKGFTKVKTLINEIIMPTPSAMMKSMELLANGYDDEVGIGELVAIDLGGATTDIYSIADGYPKESNVIYKGIEEPYVKRTVEGDIGMRYSVLGIVDEVGAEEIGNIVNLSKDKVMNYINKLIKEPYILPEDENMKSLDFAIAAKAIEIASIRHCGTKEKIYTTNGISYLQKGKDLTSVKNIIVTGGSLIHLSNIDEIIKYVLFNERKSESLRPKEANVFIDKKYILASMGLLSQSYPKTAIRIMKKELKYDGN